MKPYFLAAFLLIALTIRASADPAFSRLTVDPVQGAAPPFDLSIAKKLSGELERMGYEISPSAPLRLSGQARAVSDAAGAKIVVDWTLKEASGRIVGRFTNSEIAPYKAANPWEAVDADTINKLAHASALSVEQNLAGTDMGSNAVLSTAKAAPPERSIAPKPESGITATATKVFITGVTGAPGDGNVALPNALALYFGRFDVELLAAKAPDAYVIEGQVKTKPKNASQQTISILWLLKSPAGRELARIAQENAVRIGSLDQSWGNTANEAAEGAADGLLATMASIGKMPPKK